MLSQILIMAKKIGRPSKFSKEITDKICEIISTSSKGLVTICKQKGMPNVATVLRWLANDEYKEFRDNYTRAREAQADLLADEIIELSDKEFKSKTTTKGTGGAFSSTTISDNPARTRLQIDARKWKASKLAPKKYGDKLDVTSAGEVLKSSIATPLTPDQLKALNDAIEGKY